MKPRCQEHCPTPLRDVGMAWTRSRNVSKFCDYLDTFSEHVHGMDMFQISRHAQFAESAKPDKAIKANLKGLGYGF